MPIACLHIIISLLYEIVITKCLFAPRKHMISANKTIERERKWLNMTANWDKQMIRNFKKVIIFKIICVLIYVLNILYL